MSAVQAGRELNLDEIVEGARQMTGLTEIGEPAIDEGLRVLIDALNREANLRPDGLEAQRMSLTGVVANRLRITEVFKQHPEIRQERIRGPIVIVGLPRSGTTKLHRMLATHHDVQSIPLWKLLNPAPLGPTPAGVEDPRIAIAEQVSAGMHDRFPDFFAGHPMLPREPDEEVWMLDQVTRGWMPCYAAYVPSYRAWADRQDMATWYDYLRELLQMFQWMDGTSEKTWLIKAPEHMGFLDLLFERFPEATIVMTHRDPVSTISSISVLTVASRRMYSDEPQPHDAGALNLERWSASLQACVVARAGLERDHTFIDAPYRDVTGNAIGLMERICAAAGLPFSDAARDAMLAWERENPQNKHGQHRYELDTVGLSEDQVRGAFSGYLDRYSDQL